MRFTVILFFMILNLLQAKENYELGEGIQLFSLPVYLGGYISTEYKKTQNTAKYNIEDIALLSYGNHERLSYMAEVEYKNFYTQKTEDSVVTTEKDTKIYIERLYLEYAFHENFIGRVGKYISPIGFWNLLPINVLRDTTSDPLNTNIIFPEFTTGIYTSYTNFQENEIAIDVMLQNNEDLDDKYSNYKINKHYGLGISYTQGNLTSKLNVGYFNKLYRYIDDEFEDHPEDDNEVEGDDDQDDDYISRSNEEQDIYYVNFGIKYETLDYQILSELGHQESSNGISTNYAFYLQGLYRITPKHNAILRFEAYDDAVTNKRDKFGVFAYTYRPIYPVALKAEYQSHELSKFNKLLISFSVLF